MNPESDFRIESTYDRQAYQAMAKATWSCSRSTGWR